MKTVYKYKISDLEYCQKLEIYEGFKILKLRVIDGECYIWAEVNTDQPKMTIDVYSCFTGAPLPFSDLVYVDSYRVNKLIIHVFWRWTADSFSK